MNQDLLSFVCPIITCKDNIHPNWTNAIHHFSHGHSPAELLDNKEGVADSIAYNKDDETLKSEIPWLYFEVSKERGRLHAFADYLPLRCPCCGYSFDDSSLLDASIHFDGHKVADIAGFRSTVTKMLGWVVTPTRLRYEDYHFIGGPESVLPRFLMGSYTLDVEVGNVWPSYESTGSLQQKLSLGQALFHLGMYQDDLIVRETHRIVAWLGDWLYSDYVKDRIFACIPWFIVVKPPWDQTPGCNCCNI